MSHLPERHIASFNFNVYHNASATVAVGNYVSWSSQHTTGHDFSLAQSGDTITLYATGHTYILEASLAPYTSSSLGSDGLSFQWEVGGAMVGNQAIGLVLLNDAEYTMTQWADERARCYVRPTGSTLSAKLKITAIHGTTPTGVDTFRSGYPARARLFVWRL